MDSLYKVHVVLRRDVVWWHSHWTLDLRLETVASVQRLEQRVDI